MIRPLPCLFSLLLLSLTGLAGCHKTPEPPAPPLRPYDRPADFRPEDLAGPVWVMKDGFVAVEAEHLPLSDFWEFQTQESEDGSVACGLGIMVWRGPDTQGGDKLVDPIQRWQGKHTDWMVTKIWVDEPGTYELTVRCFHHRKDGDNDLWQGQIGRKGTINRAGSGNPKTYHWLDWGKDRRIILRTGLNAIFTNGRSQGFGIDRIVVYKTEAANQALDPSTPESDTREEENWQD